MYRGVDSLALGEPLAPATGRGVSAPAATTLVIACGALAREILAIKEFNGLDHVDLKCLPAQLHNTPDRIPDAVRAAIHAGKKTHDHILVAFGDCGTGGLLDKVLTEESVERIAGAHCYAFFTGLEAFDGLEDDQLGTFYLTDFLARHFRTMVVEPLWLNHHPDLRDMYFGHYTRVMFLDQSGDPVLAEKAQEAADFLKLPLVHRATGYGLLADFLGSGSRAA